jgi:dUTP pyrophosphatase
MNIRIRRLHPYAILPRYQTDGAAGCDLHSIEHTVIYSQRGMNRAKVRTGLALEIPPGYEAQIRPRSGAALRDGLTVINSPATIDSDFRGEVCVLLVNLGDDWVNIDPGDRIAQLVIAPVVRATWEEVDELEATGRGAKGFGSSGVR